MTPDTPQDEQGNMETPKPQPDGQAEKQAMPTSSEGKSAPPFKRPPLNQSSPPPFGGAPITPQPERKKSRTGLYIFLGVMAFFLLFIVIIGVVIIKTISGFIGQTQVKMPKIHRSNTIAVLRIDSMIIDSEETLEIIRHYREEDKIKAVLVRVNSPGGAVGASQEIYDAILSLRESGKKVVASFGNTAASGGYYIGCAADEIVANAGALTGSIGVIFSVPNVKELSEKVGISQQVVKSGKFKDVGSMTKEMSEADRELLQGVIDDTYEQFLEAILTNRSARIGNALTYLKQNPDKTDLDLSDAQSAEDFLRQVADGRVFTGRMAMQYGLVDQLGSQEDAVDRLAELADLHDPELYEYEPIQTLFDLLTSEAKSTLGNTLPLPLGNARLEYRMP
ncbi:MAG: signal peptide peptidase SppA [Candidatus Sumerlaeia bacterium]